MCDSSLPNTSMSILVYIRHACVMQAAVTQACLGQHCDPSNSMLQERTPASEGTSMSADGKTLIKGGVSYKVGDQVYVHPETFDQLEQAAQAEVPDYAAKGRFHKASCKAVLSCTWFAFIISALHVACLQLLHYRLHSQ